MGGVNGSLPPLSEKLFEAEHVQPLANMHNWKWVHFSDSRREVKPGVFIGDAKARGWPDMVLCRDRVIYAELKSAKGKPSLYQEAWLDTLARAGGEVYLWRPGDLSEIYAILAKPWRYLARGDRTAARVTSEIGCLSRDGNCWTPNSLWVPGVGRAETATIDEGVPGQTTIHDFV